MSTNKERPIPFSSPMVRELLAGTKTQTRRKVKFAKYPEHTMLTGPRWAEPGQTIWLDPARPTGAAVSRFCTYGVPGDRLWVRERFGAFKASSIESSIKDAEYVVLADGTQVRRDGSVTPGLPKYEKGAFWFKWRPSIHMPRWASRITLEIVSVRVQRVQDISEEDAKAEGFAESRQRAGNGVNWMSAKGAFRATWEAIHGDGAWDRNEWVWVIEFRRPEDLRVREMPA